MSLTILHTEASCGWGGQEIRILDEAAGLADRGHALWLACPPQAPIAAAGRARGLRVVTLPIARKSFAGWRALRGLIAAERFDVVNSHSSTDTWLAALALATLRDAPPLVRTRHISAPVAGHAANRWLYARASRGSCRSPPASTRPASGHRPTHPSNALCARRWACRSTGPSSASSRRCAAGRVTAS
jgi:hypothetical protein